MAKVLVQLLGRLTNQVVWLGVKIGSRVCGWEGRWGREQSIGEGPQASVAKECHQRSDVF